MLTATISTLRFEVRVRREVRTVWHTLEEALIACAVLGVTHDCRIVVRGSANELTALGARPIGDGPRSVMMIWIGAEYEAVVFGSEETTC